MCVVRESFVDVSLACETDESFIIDVHRITETRNRRSRHFILSTTLLLVRISSPRFVRGWDSPGTWVRGPSVVRSADTFILVTNDSLCPDS